MRRDWDNFAQLCGPVRERRRLYCGSGAGSVDVMKFIHRAECQENKDRHCNWPSARQKVVLIAFLSEFLGFCDDDGTAVFGGFDGDSVLPLHLGVVGANDTTARVANSSEDQAPSSPGAPGSATFSPGAGEKGQRGVVHPAFGQRRQLNMPTQRNQLLRRGGEGTAGM